MNWLWIWIGSGVLFITVVAIAGGIALGRIFNMKPLSKEELAQMEADLAKKDNYRGF